MISMLQTGIFFHLRFPENNYYFVVSSTPISCVGRRIGQDVCFRGSGCFCLYFACAPLCMFGCFYVSVAIHCSMCLCVNECVLVCCG